MKKVWIASSHMTWLLCATIFATLLLPAQAHAQRYAFCLVGDGGFGGRAYFSSVFPVSDSITTDAPNDGDRSLEGFLFVVIRHEPTSSFERYVKETYGTKAIHEQPVCEFFSSFSAANEARKVYARSRHDNMASVITETGWIFNPLKQGTHTGGTKPTEAEALYDAENWSGPFEDNQYKTIHSWDSHDCTTKQVTGVAGSSKPTTFYQCTVTFSYSDTASPLAKTAFGKGDTQDAAIAAAKSSANTVLLTGITWGQPLCSPFYTTVKNAYKADYGHTAGSKKENWACEVDFTGNK